MLKFLLLSLCAISPVDGVKVKLPSEDVIMERLSHQEPFGLGVVLHTSIVPRLAGKEYDSFWVDKVVGLELYHLKERGAYRPHLRNRAAVGYYIDRFKPHIVRNILQDCPPCIQELQEAGLLKNN